MGKTELLGPGGIGDGSGYKNMREIKVIKMKRIWVSAVFVVFLTTTSGYAAFEIDGEIDPVTAKRPQQQDVRHNELQSEQDGHTVSDSPVNPRIRYYGTAPKDMPPAIGRAVDIPVETAVKQIVPQGWQVLTSELTHKDTKVSWQGRSEWILALSDIVTSSGIEAFVHWKYRVITLKGGKAPVVAAPKPPAVVAPLTPPPPPQPVYRVLKSDKTLSETLARWSREAGWQLSWEAHKDFAITLEATFTGSFKDAITNVVDGLAASDAPVQAIFYKNKVVRIVMRGTKIR